MDAPIPVVEPVSDFKPKRIAKVEDTGLSMLWLQDHILKILYYQGYLTGYQIADEASLPFTGVVDHIMETLKREKLCEVRSSSSQLGLGEGSYLYAITTSGTARAREALERSQYAGPAPVPLHLYNDAINRQTRQMMKVNQRMIRQMLSHIILNENILDMIGPAVNSGSSLFLYGPPGNGKTTISKAIGTLSKSQEMYIPYSVYVDGQVIKIFDSVNHELGEGERITKRGTASLGYDPRWIKIKRPFITVGGELTIDGMDLVFDSVNKFYEAPFQVKANGGILLIDDFGRQLVKPRDLLNRWIIPLENRIDYLTLHTGRQLEVPFDVFVIFATNLPPKELVDEAFLRRLRHKIEIGDPTYDGYREIFKKVAKGKNINYDEQGLAYLLQEWYIKKNRKLRANHPRDICEHIIDIAGYLNISPTLNPEIIDRAATAYFVDL